MGLEATLRDIGSAGSSWKHSVRAVATANITRLGLQTIDGVVLAQGDRVLLAGQTDGKQNGIYDASGAVWTRSDDLDQDVYLQLGLSTYVREGTANAGSMWFLTSPTTGTLQINVSELEFSKYTATVEGDIAVDSLTADLVTTDLVETGAVTNAGGVVAITGGTGVTINQGGLVFTISASGNVARIVGAASAGLLLSTGAGAATINGFTSVILQHNASTAFTVDKSANVARLVGGGSSGLLVSTAAGAATVDGATGVALQHGGAANFTADLSSNVSRFIGAGSSGTRVAAGTGNLIIASASGAVVSIQEGTTAVVELRDDAGVAELKLMGGSANRITAANAIIHQPGSGYYTQVNDGTGAELLTFVSNYIRLPTNTPTGTIPGGYGALGFDGTNLILRIGTTNYTITKTP